MPGHTRWSDVRHKRTGSFEFTVEIETEPGVAELTGDALDQMLDTLEEGRILRAPSLGVDDTKLSWTGIFQVWADSIGAATTIAEAQFIAAIPSEHPVAIDRVIVQRERIDH
ncbi:MAG: hypothetical protein F2663_07335 [Actinobacteria bacterium]|uniref:Unannotated protein n=1 Tax=freshwater metagenome TaxID=449393 RepID=A0A6J6Q2N5_9ZZZZ|nr:hypothetical protein [Actinomycetota bacterium]